MATNWRAEGRGVEDRVNAPLNRTTSRLACFKGSQALGLAWTTALKHPFRRFNGAEARELQPTIQLLGGARDQVNRKLSRWPSVLS